MVITRTLGVATFLGVALTAAPEAQAGIDACGNLRLEDVGNCEIHVEVDCSASCSQLGVYEKACATKLQTVCSQECTLKAEPTCSDSCTTVCEEDCNNGINVICSHNCFGECTGVCDSHCEGSVDAAQCRASCEANCDAECDIKCEPLIDASCYQHCVECCGGSCSAQANMDCQTTCQEEQFEECEYELRADCDASCSADGALFCDGEYALSGSELPACLSALIAEGIGNLEVEAEVSIGPDGVAGSIGAGACSATPAGGRKSAWPLGLLGAALGWIVLRRRRG